MLVNSLTATGLWKELACEDGQEKKKTQGPVTLFASLNSAFAQLPKECLLADCVAEIDKVLQCSHAYTLHVQAFVYRQEHKDIIACFNVDTHAWIQILLYGSASIWVCLTGMEYDKFYHRARLRSQHSWRSCAPHCWAALQTAVTLSACSMVNKQPS